LNGTPSTYATGMYVDGNSEAPHYATKWLTNVVLDLRAPIITAIKAAVSGAAPTLHVGTIANGGVGLAPFGRRRSVVPHAVLAKLPALRTGLIHSCISTNPADYVPAEKERGGGNG
jgi:basic membrane protein A and related proteins